MRADHYEVYYSDKLWNLLPAVYRTEDSTILGANGPLRELVNRIGSQAAVLRRSIDRLWEDQSIETCDDWVITYIADLLATNLVASQDARGQRLDVAKTIYYRRRKGTVAILEEIAHDITGWDARVVEFFRRLGRTRHSLDPEIGYPAATPDPAGNRALQLAEGLIGSLTNTAIGGWADLRYAFGALHAQSPFSTGAPIRPPSAFDEYFHTADFRKGRGRSGWYNIPKLGVFLWRLFSFGVDFTTPVGNPNNPACFSFDPTGRLISLFAASSRSFGDDWVSPQEWQLPGPISTPLLAHALANPEQETLYSESVPGQALEFNSLGAFAQLGTDYELADSSQVSTYPPAAGATPSVMIFPEEGRIAVLQPLRGPLFVTYHYGFSATIGAGPYDRRILGRTAHPVPVPVHKVSDGGNALAGQLAGLAPIGTLAIGDSLTYDSVADVTGIDQVAIIAANQRRPVIRLASPAPNPTEWKLSGNPLASLTLDGLLVSGGDVVLQGEFDTVNITCCTFDPGTAGKSSAFAKSIDGRDLIPCHLQVEARIRQLNVDRCILGPIQTSAAGEIEELNVSDSIIQALGADQALVLSTGVVKLNRVTVLGRATLDRLYASECILNSVFRVNDTQDGCIRFTAWSTGSVIPRKYESVEIPPGAPLFTSLEFGQPGYAQLLETVDRNIVSGAPGATISEGAEDGSEMGAFAREKTPIKRRSVLIKYQEFMPAGLVPVIIYVT
jgi:hypothetical protein